MKIKVTDFECEQNDKLKLITIEAEDGSSVVLTNYGARIVGINVPDKNGCLTDVTLGYDDAQGYLNDRGSFGAVCGRYANRIGDAVFTIDGKDYPLTANNGKNCLHGGNVGFSKKVWDYAVNDDESVSFSLFSPDGEEGFPGNMKVSVTYRFDNDHKLTLEYRAECDKDCYVNLTNHSYFNISGDVSSDAGELLLKMDAPFYTPVDSGLIPTGELRSVVDTPFDFTVLRRINEKIDCDDEQLNISGGYDHNFVLGESREMELISTKSGITMKVNTTLPGVQLYTGNFLRQTPGKKGKVYGRRCAVCLETQFYPDTPHHANFPDALLKAGAQFFETTSFSFGLID